MDYSKFSILKITLLDGEVLTYDRYKFDYCFNMNRGSYLIRDKYDYTVAEIPKTSVKYISLEEDNND